MGVPTLPIRKTSTCPTLVEPGWIVDQHALALGQDRVVRGVPRTWLAEREQSWRDAVEVVATDGFTGFKTAAAEGLPDAVAVTDPFHVVRLAGDALDRCRRRVRQNLHGHRGRKDDPALLRAPDAAYRT